MMISISRSMGPVYDPSPVQSSVVAASLPIIQRPLSQRPKLSINTQQPRVLGKASSLRLDLLTAVSPTVRNTVSNAHEQPSTAPALQRPSKPQPSPIDSSFSHARRQHTPDSASTLSSAFISASNQPATFSVPYKQPHNLTSILTNSPASSRAPRKMALARPFFLSPKRVSFRTPLEEEIKTVRYTLAHSDLDASSSTLSSTLSSAATNSAGSDAASDSTRLASTSKAILSISTPLLTSRSAMPPMADSPLPHSPQPGDKRDSSSDDDDDDDGDDDDSDCPETPVAGRRKRKRDWRWTLGPLPRTSHPASSSEPSASEESS